MEYLQRLVVDDATEAALRTLYPDHPPSRIRLDSDDPVELDDPTQLVVDCHAFRGNPTLRELAASLAASDGYVGLALPPQGHDCWTTAVAKKSAAKLRRHLNRRRRLTVERVMESLRGSDLPTDVIACFNHCHAVTRVESREVILTRIDEHDGSEGIKFQTVADLRLRYRNWSVGDRSAVSLWLESPDRRDYKGVVFAPGERRVTRGYFNLFSGFAVEPVEGDCEPFRQHLSEVICGGDAGHTDYVWRWLAHLVQRPRERPEVALVLVGGQGCGKGCFVDAVGSLFGRHYLAIHRLEQLTGRFNAHLREAFLIHANEAVWEGRASDIGALKGIITDPYFTIEHKGVDAIRLPNYRRLIVASNSDQPVAMDMDDRRFFVRRVSDDRVADRAYFRRYFRWLKRGGREALLHALLHADLAGFDPRRMPHTAEAFAMKLRGASTVVVWWYESLADGRLYGGRESWPALLPTQELFRAYEAWCESQHRRILPAQCLGQELARLLDGTDFGRVHRRRDGRRYWAYALPPVEAARKAFERAAKAGPDIWPE